MAVDEADKVDAIGVDRTTGYVVLTISDHLSWAESEELHREVLREKINSYLAFIESGELYKTYPNAVGRQVLISVAGKFDLSPVGCEFFTNATEVIRRAGFNLEFKKADPFN
jgi:hypothetical protein